MRTTLDLPDPVLRELKMLAAQSGTSLKALLNDLIVRAMRLPQAPPQAAVDLPVLARLSKKKSAARKPALTNAQLAELEHDADIEKLRRIGFLR